MTGADYSIRQNLRKALDALQHEHAAEMQPPRYKRHILDNDKQASVSLFKHSQPAVFMRRILSRFNIIHYPVAVLKNRVVSLFAYANR